MLKNAAQYNRELLSYPNEVHLFGETKIDKYLSHNESNMVIYPEDAFEIIPDAEDDAVSTTGPREREQALMNMLLQFDQTPSKWS